MNKLKPLALAGIMASVFSGAAMADQYLVKLNDSVNGDLIVIELDTELSPDLSKVLSNNESVLRVKAGAKELSFSKTFSSSISLSKTKSIDWDVNIGKIALKNDNGELVDTYQIKAVVNQTTEMSHGKKSFTVGDSDAFKQKRTSHFMARFSLPDVKNEPVTILSMTNKNSKQAITVEKQ